MCTEVTMTGCNHLAVFCKAPKLSDGGVDGKLPRVVQRRLWAVLRVTISAHYYARTLALAPCPR